MTRWVGAAVLAILLAGCAAEGPARRAEVVKD